MRIPCNHKASRTIRSAQIDRGYNAGRLLLLVNGSVDRALRPRNCRLQDQSRASRNADAHGFLLDAAVLGGHGTDGYDDD